VLEITSKRCRRPRIVDRGPHTFDQETTTEVIAMFSAEAAKDMIRDRVREAEADRIARTMRKVRAARERAKTRRVGSVLAVIAWPTRG
jgi:hypothetical protein